MQNQPRQPFMTRYAIRSDLLPCLGRKTKFNLMMPFTWTSSFLSSSIRTAIGYNESSWVSFAAIPEYLRYSNYLYSPPSEFSSPTLKVHLTSCSNLKEIGIDPQCIVVATGPYFTWVVMWDSSIPDFRNLTYLKFFGIQIFLVIWVKTIVCIFINWCYF